MLERLRLLTRATGNPIFFREELARVLADEPERLNRALNDPDCVDVLTWNVFASLDTHSDRDWLANQLAAMGLSGVRAPLRISIWSGHRTGPLLKPSSAYLAGIRRRSSTAGASADQLGAFAAAIEVPVRIESPEVLALVDTALARYPRGAAGRDRTLELIDAGLEHAHRLGKSLIVAAVTPAGSQAESQVAERIRQLAIPQALAQELGREPRTSVELRQISWQELLELWQSSQRYLRLDRAPVKAFGAHCSKVLAPQPSRRAG
ncbi:MAG TPA: hypothetical protein VML96_13000 [Egibacteraceae bacterium]|nr:hypothetical protein [Egibacteraceae bacterium]